MKQGPNQKRHRGRSNGRRHQHGLSSNYESNGPEVKIKGSASQVQDRYQALARDAIASGDRIAAENYLQHAEHYQRIINAHLAANAANNAANAGDGNGAARVNGSGEQPETRQRGEEGRSRGRGRGRGRGQGQHADQPVEPNAPQPELAHEKERPKASERAKPADDGAEAATKPQGEPEAGDSATA